MLNNKTLRTIQSGTINEVYATVTNAALFMATGGFINQANKLLTALWNYKLPHDRNTWLADRAFIMLWHAAKNKPDFIPFELTDLDELEKYHRGYMIIDKWATGVKEKDWKEMSIPDLFKTAWKTAALEKPNEKNIDFISVTTPDLKEGETSMINMMEAVSAFFESNQPEITDNFPSREKELLAADMLEKYIHNFPGNYEASCMAAELNARNNRINNAIYFSKLCAAAYNARPNGISLALIGCNRHVAPLLLQNILANELKISEKECAEFNDIAIKVLDKSISDGRSLVYGNLSWKKLIKKLSMLSVKNFAEDFSNEVQKNKWLGFEKATTTEIKAAEKRLDITLPEDYKTFLKTTNGLLNFPILNPTLVPVEKIDYLKNVEPQELFIMYDDFPVEGGDPESFNDYVSRAILISNYPEEQMIWLIPPKEKYGDWQTWFFAYWVPGEIRYPSFRHFMEKQIQTIEQD